MIIDIKALITKLCQNRKAFFSEADFQFSLATTIKEKYKDADVLLEYHPDFDKDMHIDILVIKDGKWIPIELKYKTKECEIQISDHKYRLKEQGARDLGGYYYLKDIERIEKIRKNKNLFAEGYTIFVTNDGRYKNKPRDGVNYAAFALNEGCVKTGTMDWKEGSSAKQEGSTINLTGFYPIKWNDYSEINGERFYYLYNKIENKKEKNDR